MGSLKCICQGNFLLIWFQYGSVNHLTVLIISYKIFLPENLHMWSEGSHYRMTDSLFCCMLLTYFSSFFSGKLLRVDCSTKEYGKLYQLATCYQIIQTPVSDSCSSPPGVLQSGRATYLLVPNIRCTNTPNFNVSRLILQLSLPKLLMPGIKSRMKM